jgi:hypothetical protein
MNNAAENNTKKNKKNNTIKKQMSNNETYVYEKLSKLNNKNFKSIKIPEKFEEKEKLFDSLKGAIGEIDMEMKNLKLKKEYYNELLEKLDKEIKIKKEVDMLKNKPSDISIIQEELYSKFLVIFIALYE